MKKSQKLNKAVFAKILNALICIFLCLGANHATAREMTEFPRVRLQSLDKATARTMTFDAQIGHTLKFGTLYIRVQSCQKSSPVDEPESAAFLQIWEVDTDNKAEWVFSGWMFASSPGLSPMDHPIYDVWVLDCLNTKEEEERKALEAAVPLEQRQEEMEDFVNIEGADADTATQSDVSLPEDATDNVE